MPITFSNNNGSTNAPLNFTRIQRLHMQSGSFVFNEPVTVQRLTWDGTLNCITGSVTHNQDGSITINAGTRIECTNHDQMDVEMIGDLSGPAE